MRDGDLEAKLERAEETYEDLLRTRASLGSRNQITYGSWYLLPGYAPRLHPARIADQTLPS